MSCEKNSQVQALYDGELPLAQRLDVEAHLRQCADCAALLTDLKRMSQFISTAPFAPMPAETRKRVQQAWWAAQSERGVLRVAELMTGLAAAVLIGAMIFWPTTRKQNTTAVVPTNWQTAAVMPPGGADDEPVADVVELAQWMASDLSGAGAGAGAMNR
jgi:anti-sigma factor RsiW